jgi:hypothetical protein
MLKKIALVMVMLTGWLAVAAALEPAEAIERAIGYIGKERQEIRGIDRDNRVVFKDTLPFLGEWFSLVFKDGKVLGVIYTYVCSPRSGIVWSLNYWKKDLSNSKRWKAVEHHELPYNLVENSKVVPDLRYSDGKYTIQIVNEEMGPDEGDSWKIVCMVSTYPDS